MNVRRLGERPAAPPHYAELIAREDRRIAKLSKELNRARRALDRARMRKSVLLRLANDEARVHDSPVRCPSCGMPDHGTAACVLTAVLAFRDAGARDLALRLCSR